MVGKLIGTGSYLPSRVLTNNDIAEMVETTDKWIRERTGIKTRCITEDDTTTSMAIKASNEALKNAKIKPEKIDMIIVATLTPDVLVPNVSSYVQKSIGAINAQCMDVNSACTGFLLGYQIAQSYIGTGSVKNALIIGAENLSAITNFKDRSNCIIFGDGAGACVLTAAEGKIVSLMHNDGSRGNVLECEARTPKDWETREKNKLTYIRMDGQEVFKFATKEVPNVINEVLRKADANISDLDYLILHQANQRIIDYIKKKLNVDDEKVPSNISKYGNTSSASIPILIDEMNKDDKFNDGQKIVIAGFGGGLSWGASYINV
ncbi:MAG TPA: beta-ketoacyl-ACP synthase III [Anaerovoracaceae bacterium]|nr:beta-ketoacyl-ACP synthase III [Anaerovoracaceae bacterium]